MSKRISRGTYYVTALRTREGRTYADQVGRQMQTSAEAMSILDLLNERGYVQQWSQNQQQRFVVAERDATGSWTSMNPFTGKRELLEVR